MSLSTSVPALVDSLSPFLASLRAKAPGVPGWIATIADKLWPKLEGDKSAREALKELEAHPSDEDVRGAFRLALRKLLEKNATLDSELTRLMGPRNEPGTSAALTVDGLDRSDESLKRLEMLRLLRAGVPAPEIARQFKVEVSHLFHLNAAFTVQGMLGLATSAPARRWFDQLNHEDPLLRRLEMVRLLRAGVPVGVVAAEFEAVAEYVERLAERFVTEGAAGLLGDAEVKRFHELHPPIVRVATYNLHGTHDGDDDRYRLIARELSDFEPDLIAFQEVISGAGVRETSAQLAEKMSAMAGADYRTFFAHCHLFMEKFPEGVAVAGRLAFSDPRVIDLNAGLSGGVKPTMPRFAAAFRTEILGRQIAFASTHLDHAGDTRVRAAQASKLVAEMERLFPTAQMTIVAGDMNDVEASAAIACFEELGFVDAYRACHLTGGDTFPAADPTTRIDFILVKGAAQIVSARTGLAHSSLSDHLGVFAVVR
jgi:endonuclease/exonuclease/phosphatase family metal-dependent hydrolase